VPSPAAHFLAGLTAHIATAPREQIALRRRTAITVAAAMAPDVDFLFKALGLATHQGASHSVGAALIAGAAVGVVALVARWPGAGGLALAATIGWSSHILLDLLNVDTHPPVGLMALWPFSKDYFKSPWPVFLDIGRTLSWRTVRHDILAIAWEMATLGALLLVAWRARGRRRLGAWDGARFREQVGR
jgi:inner membrane protein